MLIQHKNLKLAYSFTRTAFCSHCAKEERPCKGNHILVFPQQKSLDEEIPLPKIYKVSPSFNKNHYGFTPHLFRVQEIHRNRSFIPRSCEIVGIEFESLCLVDTCGITLIKSDHIADEFCDYQINQARMESVILSPERAHALFGFTNNGYEINYHQESL